MQLLGKVALVTGGANGIGRAFARALARQGADVVIADFDRPRLDEALVELTSLYQRGRLTALHVDVRKEVSVKKMAADAIAAVGQVDVLVNGAGVLLSGDLEQISSRDWNWMLRTNLLGTARCVTALLPHFLARGSGHVVNVVAFGGLVPQGSHSIAYDAGEAAIAAFSEGLALELKPKGIGVTLLCTGRSGPRPGQNTRVRGLRTWLRRQPLGPDGSQGLEQLEDLLVDALRSERFLALAAEDQRLLRARWRDLDADLSRRLEAAVTSGL
jgi:NAD(P)-dependent dehydrogenase (short-subunit alcohol dehydrogenase family)